MSKKIKLADVVSSRYAHLTPPNEENIERIRVDLVSGSKVMLNEPHVFREGAKWELLAGHDRVEAARRAGWVEIQVRDFVAGLNTDDAILAHFCKENLLRKDISKASIAGQWLKSHPDWSDGKVADESGCTPTYVGEVRAELVASGDIKLVSSRVGRDGRTTTSERAPREPRKGALSRPDRPTPAKPKSTDDIAAEMTARAEATRKANEARAKASGSEQVAPEPDRGSTGEDSQVPPSEVGAPTGARSLDSGSQSATPVTAPPSVGAVASNTLPSVEPEASVEGESNPPASSVGSPVPEVGTSAVVSGGRVSEEPVLSSAVGALVGLTANLHGLIVRAAPAEYRAAGVALGRERFEGAKAFALWLGGFLLQAEIGIKEAEKAEAEQMAGAA